jgi:hypothetical protein
VAVRFVRIGSPKTILERKTTAVKRTYHMVDRKAAAAVAKVEEFAKANGQTLLPLVELVTQARVAVDEVIDRIGRQTSETILRSECRTSSRAAHGRVRAAAISAGTDRRTAASVLLTGRSK